MHFRYIRYILVSFLVFFSADLFSQEQAIQNIRTGFEKVIRGIQQVGSFADALIRNNLRQSEQLPFVSSRRFNEQFEVGSETLFLTIKNEFGKVSIRSWNNPIVKIEANVLMGGKSNEVVEKAIDSFNMGILKQDNYVYIQWQTLNEGVEYLQVDYDLVVPRFASVNVENFFGDVVIREILGDVKVLCQFGNVDVQNIGGNVSVSTQGEFSLLLKKVAGKANLNFIRTKAEIVDVKGDLNLNSLMSEVLLREISSPNASIHIDGGEMKYYFLSGKSCNIVGSMIGGEVVSDLPIVKKSLGYFTKVELLNPETSNQLQFSANFANVILLSETNIESEMNKAVSGAKPFTDVSAFEEEVNPDDVLIVTNQKGGIHLIGSETNKITVRVSRLIWLPNSEKVPTVMEKITKDFHRTDNRLYLTVRGLLEDFGTEVADWRADIQIMCPAFLSVNVESGGGETTFESLEKSLRVNQDGGNLTLKNVKGEYFISMANGSVYLENSDGIGDINIKKGLISAKLIGGSLSLNGFQTRINFEDVSAKARVLLQDGEIKVLFFSDLVNDLELKCKDGNISLVLPPNPDCKIKATVSNGVIDSIYSLTGYFSRLKQEGETILGAGKVNLLLECDNGDIFIGGKPNISEAVPEKDAETSAGKENSTGN